MPSERDGKRDPTGALPNDILKSHFQLGEKPTKRKLKNRQILKKKRNESECKFLTNRNQLNGTEFATNRRHIMYANGSMSWENGF